MSNFYIADTHFYHNNIIKYDKRPFANIYDMNRKLMENWNNVVGDNDTVFVLGDVSWRDPNQTYNEVISKLKGHKVLIRGNHDGYDYDELFEEVSDYMEIRENGKDVILCHYPMCSFNGSFKGAYHLYGHVHVTNEYDVINKFTKKYVEDIKRPIHMCNVGCMMPWMDYTPRTLEEIKAAMKW